MSSDQRVRFTAGRVRDFKCPDGKARAYLWDSDAPGFGLRVTDRGAKSYIFQARIRGELVRITIGSPDAWAIDNPDPKHPGARQEARRLRRLIDKGIDPRDERRERDEVAAAKRIEAQATSHTLRKLCEVYVEHLKHAGKQSWHDAGSIFRLHVYTSPHADRPAKAIVMRDVTELLRRVTEAGYGRTAAKLRAYLRAAYALALRAEGDPLAPADLIAFDIQSNPAAATGTLARFNRALDRTLSPDELRAYLARLRAEPAAIRAPLMLALLLGGQRPAQLLRVTLADVDLAGASITLRDPKGRRHQPRAHVLPLIGEAATLAAELVTAREDAKAKSIDALFLAGRRHTRTGDLSGAVASICTAMLATEPAEARRAFELRDLRRTCETMLAAMGISKDVRAQIQSHGLGGIQARHYDRHEYAEEKRNALKAWAEKLAQIEAGAPPASNVIEMGGRRQA